MEWTTVHNDNGSIDYVTPLPGPVARYEDATQVLRWYNRQERSWVVSFADEQRHQVGPSEYVYSLEDAIDEAAHLIGQADPTPAQGAPAMTDIGHAEDYVDALTADEARTLHAALTARLDREAAAALAARWAAIDWDALDWRPTDKGESAPLPTDLWDCTSCSDDSGWTERVTAQRDPDGTITVHPECGHCGYEPTLDREGNVVDSIFS